MVNNQLAKTHSVELNAAELERVLGESTSLAHKVDASVNRGGSGGKTVTEFLNAFGNSGARYKTNIETLPDALRRVASLRGVSYEWRGAEFRDQRFPQGRAVGVLAHEVERVLPEAVVTGPNGYKGVYYAQLIPLLIESVKELKAQNDELRDMIVDNIGARPNRVVAPGSGLRGLVRRALQGLWSPPDRLQELK